MSDKRLTARQRLFASEYLVDLNATQAAIRAGYKPDSASQTGCRIMQKPEIAQIIAEEQKAREARTLITQDRVLERLADIAFNEGHKDSDALRALEFCARHLGMFKERVDPVSKDLDISHLSMDDRVRRLSFLLSKARGEHDGCQK